MQRRYQLWEICKNTPNPTSWLLAVREQIKHSKCIQMWDSYIGLFCDTVPADLGTDANFRIGLKRAQLLYLRYRNSYNEKFPFYCSKGFFICSERYLMSFIVIIQNQVFRHTLRKLKGEQILTLLAFCSICSSCYRGYFYLLPPVFVSGIR